MSDITADTVIQVIDHLRDIITPLGMKVYEIYYKQMMLEGVMGVMLSLIIIGVITFIPFYIKRHCDKDENGKLSKDGDEVVTFFYCIAIFIDVVVIFFMPHHIMKIANPDYYIIQNLLNM